MKVYIYELLCPLTLLPKYVGKSKNPYNRFSQHLLCKTIKTKKDSWIKSLKNIGLKPILNIIEETNNEEVNFWEIFYINLYKSWGFELKNMTTGGDSNCKFSSETKEKMKSAWVIRKNSGYINSFYGKKHTDDTKQKMKLAWNNRNIEKHVEETKKRNKILCQEGKIGFKKGNLNPKSTVVHCFDFNNNLIKTYDFIEQVKEDGFSASCVSKCLSKKQKQHKGFIFKQIFKE